MLAGIGANQSPRFRGVAVAKGFLKFEDHHFRWPSFERK